jgi:NTE family protein
MTRKSRTTGVSRVSHTTRDGGDGFLRRAWLRLFSPGESRPRIGLALSSGGAKSLAHVGVIQVFEENNIPIHAVAGVSMGAYVGAAWAAGMHGHELEALAAEIHNIQVFRKLADPAPPFLKGVFRGEKVKQHLRQSIGDISFDELEKELLVIAADLDSYERIVFREGSVLDAVHASCALPGIVVPVNAGGHRCTDGGTVEPLPVDALRTYCDVDYVIAVSTLPTFKELDHEVTDSDPMFVQDSRDGLWGKMKQSLNRNLNLAADGNTIDTLRRSIRIAQIRMAHDSCKRADIVLHAHSGQKSQWYDYHQYRHFVDLGRAVAEQALPRIEELIGKPAENEDDHESEKEQMVG